jgi:hypothetical protein
LATEENARTRLGYLCLTKGRPTKSNADKIFAELTHKRCCTPRPDVFSSQLDALRQALADRTQVNSNAACKAAAGAAFVKATPDKTPPPNPRSQTKAAADAKRKAAATTSAAAPTPAGRPQPNTDGKALKKK